MISHLIEWRNLLDILLISVGFFYIYRTLIQLGTWKIVYGIIIAAAFFLAASLMDLKGIEWIYRNVSSVAVLILVVLFQPEMRKLFEKAASIRRTRSGAFDKTLHSIYSESLWRLSEKGVGAIIVFPGHEEIDEWLNGGFPLNASPSIPLILSIFDPNSPGHDGALIVGKDNLFSFGVRLPISQSGRLSEEYGTRHQSSMGMSEKTDAMILVVSEERKKISAFHKGKMTVMRDAAHIADTIMNHCSYSGILTPRPGGGRINKQLLLESIVCLLAAVLIWVIVISGQAEILEKIVTVPLEYSASAEDFTLTGERVKDVRLHLAGEKAKFDKLAFSKLKVQIDLTKAAKGKQTILIGPENILLPKGIKLLKVEPSAIEIDLAQLEKVQLNIKPQMIGTVSKGQSIVTVHISPEKVYALVPILRNKKEKLILTTTPVYLDKITEDTTLYCKIISPPWVQPVDKLWPDVEIKLKIKIKP